MPAKSRRRATPGQSRSRARGSTSRSSAHAPKGARPAGSRRTRAARSTARRAGRKPATATRILVKRRKRRPAVAPALPFAPPTPERVAAILNILGSLYPNPETALHFQNPLQLLVATILSAQCTDERVNQVTPALFARYPDAASLASADRAELEKIIHSTGFFRAKARSIREAAAQIVARHGGQVPNTMEALTALPGVGRKTANVVLGNAFGIPGIVVDTHVQRLSNRLGLTNERDPVKIEMALQQILPQNTWTAFSHWLILHGRSVCVARKPRCNNCALALHCPRTGVTVSQ